jgi:superfamily II DNA or RNA helicase
VPSEIYRTRQPSVTGNDALRTPQRRAYEEIANFLAGTDPEREVGIVLPVGCGKSGVIALAPFAYRSRRTLVIAPGVRIATQLLGDFDPTQRAFYINRRVLDRPPYPEPVPIRGATTNTADLEQADVVVTNIGQLQGEDNRWLQQLAQDFFDLIVFDEAHHNVAESWELLRAKFPEARVLNLSATPVRADGRLMAGRIIYSYPVADAIRQGFVKTLKAQVLNPTTLRFVRREGEDETETIVPLEEVIQRGAEDAGFRRSILTSRETLGTIVDASIVELRRLQQVTGERRLKIIASALNYEHCIDIVRGYRERGLQADYVHSRQESPANQRVLKRLEDHELEVIVQVRQLGEGFDHPYLSVAAVFSIFANLSPFIQFVGRIMRVIVPDSPGHPLNNGTVIFHAGANIADRWADFRTFSQADQEYFAQLLPIEDLPFQRPDDIIERIPVRPDAQEMRSEGEVLVAEIPLLQDPDVRRAVEVLRDRGFTADQYQRALETLPRVPTTRVRERQAARQALDPKVKTEVGRILAERGIRPMGRELDTRRRRTNFQTLKSAIDRRIADLVGRRPGQRSEYSRADLDLVEREFDRLVREAVSEVLNA